MANPNVPAAMQQFVDDELMRAPLLVDQVIEAAVEHLRNGMAAMMPHDRSVASDLMQSVLSNRQHIVDYYVRSLGDQVNARLNQQPVVAAAAPAEPKLSLSLSLVDEGEVAVDVEISHTIETVRSVAEYELRELQTFTSALVGDMSVATDHNPFSAEIHARSLWAAAQALPRSRGYQLTFMRHASTPLAQVLRKTYAGASSRLEAAGVEPASYRTLILPGGSRRSKPSETTFNPDLHRIRDSMPVRETPGTPAEPLDQVLQQADDQLRSLPPDAGLDEHGRLRQLQRERLVESATSKVDQQLIQLLSRLFDAILTDAHLAQDIRLLISRLQSPVLRVALRDPTTLDQDSHPVWLLIDRIAFLGDVMPDAGDPARLEALRFVQELIDHLMGEPEQNASLYNWAVDRLQRNQQHRLDQRCNALAGEIESLQLLEDRLAASQSAPTSLHGALDLAHLDTVPAELIDEGTTRRKPGSDAQAWLQQRRAGDWVRMFMQGRWVHAQLLWPGERGELWLFGDGSTDTTWAVRRRALLTLHEEGLLDTLVVRSLVRRAAKRVMRRMVRAE